MIKKNLKLNFKFNKKKLKKILKIAIYSGLALFVAGILSGIIVFAYFAKDLPDPEKISDRKVVESTKIYDRTGIVLLYEIHGEEKRTVVSSEEIPKMIKQATVAIEDREFYEHRGLDFTGIIRAALANLRGKSIRQGGSTITQQFVKNSILTSERVYTRKIKEAILSVEMERKFSKDEILTMYLNEIPYGSNSYGIEAASKTFFGKPAKDLELHETALLASLPNAPTYYSPYGTHTEELKGRQEFTLTRMHELGYITKEEMEQAKKQKLIIEPHREAIKAPHFVMYVKELLSEKYGDDALEQGGLKVITTLDWEKQQIAEEAVKNGIEKNGKKYQATNAALTAIDPKTGQILTMVGSVDYFDVENDGNVNVSIMPRSPGSSFKPFAYAAAFKKGFTPDTILFDLKTDFGAGGKSYAPQNYNGQTSGPVTIRQALATSLNIPAVKALYLAGINNTLDLAESMGITTLTNRENYGLALALGGGDVKLLEQTAAYSVFANEGTKNENVPILKITDTSGKIVEEFELKEQNILDKEIARKITDILSDNDARSPIFGPRSKLILPNRSVAAKTGTTQDYRDAWTMGYTPSLIAGVWVGNNQAGVYMKGGADGSVVAAPIWNEFMSKALESTEAESFTKPQNKPTQKAMLDGKFENETTLKIDKISGKIATELTPPELVEEKIFKEVHSILYYVDKNKPLESQPSNPALDPQFAGWEGPVLSWAQSQGYNQAIPTEYDDVHTPENEPVITITNPKTNAVIVTPILNIEATVTAPLGVKQVDFFLDDNLIGTDNSPSYGFSLTFPFNETAVKHKITVRAYDTVGNKKNAKIEFETNINDITKPTVSLSPIPNSEVISGQIKLKAAATDTESGIKKIEFYYYISSLSGAALNNNGSLSITNPTPPVSETLPPILIGTVSSTEIFTTTYELIWNLKNIPIGTGTINIYAIATDKAQNTQTSNEVIIVR